MKMISDNSLDSHQQYYAALLLRGGIAKINEKKLSEMVKKVTALVWVNWENPIHNMFST
jgi:hypothetical protein